MQSHVGWGTLTGDGITKYTQKDTNEYETQFGRKKKTGFEIKSQTEGQCQSNPKSIGILTVLSCICGPNLEILTPIGGDLSHRQLKRG